MCCREGLDKPPKDAHKGPTLAASVIEQQQQQQQNLVSSIRAASRDAFAELSRNVPPTKTNKDGVDVLDLAEAQAIVSISPIKAKHHEPSRVPVLSPPARLSKELSPLTPSSPGLIIPHSTNWDSDMSDWIVPLPSPELEINSATRRGQTVDSPIHALPSSSISGFGEHLLEDAEELQALEDILCTRRRVEKRKNPDHRTASVPETDEDLPQRPREDATTTTIDGSPPSGAALDNAATAASQVNLNSGGKRLLEYQSGKTVNPKGYVPSL